MILMKIIIAVLIVYCVFCVGPGIVAYILTFCRKNDTGNLQSDPITHFYKGYEAEYKEKLERIKAIPSKRVTIKGNDGAKLSADYYRNGSDKLAILFHGYRTDPYVNFAGYGSILWDIKYDLLIVYERGHFPSEGSTSMAVLEREDLILWTEYAKKAFNPTAIVIGGVSMGGATVAYASDRLKEVNALILDCPFLSPYVQMANECKERHILPALVMPTIRLCGYIHLKQDIKEPVTKHLKNTDIPVLMIHGDKDKTVDFSYGELIFDSVASKKTFLKIKDAGHAAGMIIGGEDAAQKLSDFILECENV